MDGTSPAHKGPQIYENPPTSAWTVSPFFTLGIWLNEARKHSAREAKISPQQLKAAVNLVRAEYRNTYGDQRYYNAILPRSHQVWKGKSRPSDICPQGKGKCELTSSTIVAVEDAK